MVKFEKLKIFLWYSTYKILQDYKVLTEPLEEYVRFIGVPCSAGLYSWNEHHIDLMDENWGSKDFLELYRKFIDKKTIIKLLDNLKFKDKFYQYLGKINEHIDIESW